MLFNRLNIFMATDTFINITDLQSITEIADGDYLIVETPAGTRIIDFKDFIIPNTNILLSSTVSENTTAILQNKSTFDTTIASISTTINEISGSSFSQSRSNLLFTETVSSSLDTKLTTGLTDLSTSLGTKLNKIFVSKTEVTIPINNSSKDFSITPTYSLELFSKDISITPANSYAALNHAYVSNVSYNSTTNTNTITITAPFSGSPAIATQNAIYNIMIVCN
jgi:hypothetical protein